MSRCFLQKIVFGHEINHLISFLDDSLLRLFLRAQFVVSFTIVLFMFDGFGHRLFVRDYSSCYCC